MIITGRHGDYDVKYAQVGWTYAEINVYTIKTRRINLGLFAIPMRKRTKVWTSCGPNNRTLNYDTMERMYPKPMRALFQSVVDEYENYIDAWNAEYDISIPSNERPKQRLIDS